MNWHSTFLLSDREITLVMGSSPILLWYSCTMNVVYLIHVMNEYKMRFQILIYDQTIVFSQFFQAFNSSIINSYINFKSITKWHLNNFIIHTNFWFFFNSSTSSINFFLIILFAISESQWHQWKASGRNHVYESFHVSGRAP